MLYGLADAKTTKPHPPGCLALNCSLPCFDEAEDSIRHDLAERRKATFGFASERSAMQRSPWVPDDMKGKLDTVYCILVVATAVLVGIIKCISNGNDESP